jgi:hypothetical protein
VNDRGWQRTFEDPIPLPGGRTLVTLHDAATYAAKLPKAESDAAEWQAAVEALMLAAQSGGPTMFARIGVMRALDAQLASRRLRRLQPNKVRYETVALSRGFRGRAGRMPTP